VDDEMKIDKNKIALEIDKILPKIIDIRQHLHANPELSLREAQTFRFIRNQLKSLDLDILPPFLSTDVVALLKGKSVENNVTLRADMDALPIQEKNSIPYRSINSGVMHACGHDGHTAILIGAAIILEKLRKQLNGTVRFVFQPGEELVAAGKDLIEKGILNSPKPLAVLALHSWPGYPTGVICSRPGPLMAAADIYTIKIKGKGGHGSRPEQTSDPILIASNIINSMYLLPSRKFSALDSVVISICKISGGTNSNVIPDEVRMEGTARYFTKHVGEKIPQLLEDVIDKECKSFGAEYDLTYERPYIPVVNDSTIIKMCKEFTQNFMGESFWFDIAEPVMSSEDFSYYIDTIPGGMFFLGMGENSPDLHVNSFNFNDKALRNGILFLVISTLGLLNK
jgi:amidohydrolase